jgi:uncharacterized protein YbaA (DUF1428 family)
VAYVDGFVTPIPKKKLAAYKKVSRAVGRIFRDLGAVEFRECLADDVKWGKLTSFPRAVKQKPGETVAFSYIVYKSRAQRDSVTRRAMKDKRMAKYMDPKNFPFDGRRMIWGGFRVMVDL